MADQASKHEFRVSLSGLELDSKQIERINRSVQAAVLAELGRLDLEGDVGIRFPRPPILGLILLPVRDLVE